MGAGEWEGGGVGSRRWVIPSINSAVSSVSDRNRLNHRIGQDGHCCSLTPVTSLLMPFTGPTDPVVHLGGLKGSTKSHLESKFGHL